MTRDEHAAGRSRVWLIVALGSLSAFGPLCLDMYLPALPVLPGELNSTAAAAQLSLSACIIGLAVGQVITGPLSDRLGRRRPLLLGVALFALVSALCAVTTSMTLLIGLRLVQGAAGAAGIVIGRAVIADLFTGKAAASFFAAVASINGLAPILAPVIGGQILRVGTWRTVFWVLAGIGVVLLVLAFFVIRESLPPSRRSAGGLGATRRAFGTLVRDRGYVGCVLAGSLVTAAMFGYISASPFLLQDRFGLSAQWFSACFALNALGIVAATQVGRLLLRRVSSLWLLSLGVVQGLLGAMLLAVTVAAGWGLAMVLVSLFVMVSAVGFALPHASAIAMDRHRRIAGSASALLGLTQFALGAVTAPLVGLGDPASGVALAGTAVIATGLGALALLVGRSAVGGPGPARVVGAG
ncbi:Bcr/CflA family efflux MFS transporter [Nakamurella multipartita]|uniref:Drug resistance transporter, Bcr/CflA subfamily n=1 Tax=Nakamurella multipartita (strain ATCC 700099 / DSM 44233 / CIP 104796 / JCM 9543 / NBRC 105858 / Y-104) TaxID=479431 RepID=C8XDJ1_NAKMY|nr:Bcr/CflA family efflux MFS transporter [Nakamurella multipartita]ACV77655.1 drug resistance transporter, Bcr/CflA subfamily [Nakamurella multipartita DSM 44233]HOZ56990.1 Bcr/CflA family efflux MFS transporter [Nakamurella multipartita]